MSVCVCVCVCVCEFVCLHDNLWGIVLDVCKVDKVFVSLLQLTYHPGL